jgi:hypothetical protein
MSADQTTGQRVYSITLVRTEYAVVHFHAADPVAAEAIAVRLTADPALLPRVEATPTRWSSDDPAMRRASGIVTDVTDAWAAGLRMVADAESAS